MMKHGNRVITAWLTGAAVVLVAAVALAHGGGSGMMQGSGDRGTGGMQGYGGMGPGMMGPGMMGPGMMGPGMMGPGMMQGGIDPYAAGVLGLDDGQRRELEAIERESAREHWQLMQEMQSRRQAMMRLYRDGPPDPDELGAAFERLADVQRRMLENRARVHQRMHGVLTDEQRQRLGDMHGFGRQGGHGYMHE